MAVGVAAGVAAGAAAGVAAGVAIGVAAGVAAVPGNDADPGTATVLGGNHGHRPW